MKIEKVEFIRESYYPNFEKKLKEFVLENKDREVQISIDVTLGGESCAVVLVGEKKIEEAEKTNIDGIVPAKRGRPRKEYETP